MAKQLKTAVQTGAGPDPGYQWRVIYLDLARRDALGFLDECQYHHIADQIKQLAREDDPTHPRTLSVDKVEDFYELREKGGPLGKINVRVFFIVQPHPTRQIVIIGAIKKENEGATPIGDKVRMRRRCRRFHNGDYGQLP